MSEMIERIMRAMVVDLQRQCVYVGGDTEDDFECIPVDGAVHFEPLARAVLTAMREPTQEMFLAAERAGISFATQERVWPFMIDLVLSDTETGR